MTTQQLELTESRQRCDWSRQSQRLYDFIIAHPGLDIPAPTLNRVAAGNGQYVSSLSKRISEVRSRLKSEGHDFILSKDDWSSGIRKTAYKLVL